MYVCMYVYILLCIYTLYISGGAESQAMCSHEIWCDQKICSHPFPSVLTFGANIFSCEQFCTPKIFRGFAAHKIFM